MWRSNREVRRRVRWLLASARVERRLTAARSLPDGYQQGQRGPWASRAAKARSEGRQRVDRRAACSPRPRNLETAKVFDMLLALPKVGSVKATRILNGCRVSSSKTFGGPSERRRAELAGRLNR